MQPTQQAKFRVLVGDTSVRSRLVLSGMIDAEPFLEVIDTATTKEELLSKAVSSRPDLIVAHAGLTLSGHLPAFLPLYGEGSPLLLMVSQEMAQAKPTSAGGPLKLFNWPVIPVAGDTLKVKQGSKVSLMATLRALVAKYTPAPNPAEVKQKETEEGKSSQSIRPAGVCLPPRHDGPLTLVVIGASTGGSAAIEYLIKDLSLKQPAVVLVAVHMPAKFTRRLAQRLQKLTKWQVEEGGPGMVLAPNTIIIAPGGNNMRVATHPFWPNVLSLELESSEALDSPSVDELMASAARCAREQVLGVIMTGMGQDGTAGAKEIIKRGGIVIAQDEATSSIYGMAKAAVESGAVNGEFALGQINSIINRFVADRNRSHTLHRIAIG